MSRTTSSSGLCLTDPATLGVGAGLQIVSAMLCTTTLRFLGLGTIAVLVIVQHSLTLEVFVPHAHFVHCPDFEKDFL